MKMTVFLDCRSLKLSENILNEKKNLDLNNQNQKTNEHTN